MKAYYHDTKLDGKIISEEKSSSSLDEEIFTHANTFFYKVDLML
jgi:hypothetical protein